MRCLPGVAHHFRHTYMYISVSANRSDVCVSNDENLVLKTWGLLHFVFFLAEDDRYNVYFITLLIHFFFQSRHLLIWITPVRNAFHDISVSRSTKGHFLAKKVGCFNEEPVHDFCEFLLYCLSHPNPESFDWYAETKYKPKRSVHKTST